MKRFSLTSLWNSVHHSSLTSEPENIRAEDLEPRVKYWMRSTIQNSININFHQRYSFHKFYSPLKMEQVQKFVVLNFIKHLPTFCCFFRRWHPLADSDSSFTCNSPQRIPSTFRFILQKKDLRAPGHNLDTPWGTSVFTGNIAVTATHFDVFNVSLFP